MNSIRKYRPGRRLRETPAPAGLEQPVDPAGVVENARDTLGGNCAGAESAFPTTPWTATDGADVFQLVLSVQSGPPVAS